MKITRKVDRTIEVPDKVLDDLAFDLITTAVEGGINYWASVEVYKWTDPDLGRGDTKRAYVQLHESEYSDDPPVFRVDIDLMTSAITQVLMAGHFHLPNIGYDEPFEVRLANHFEEVAKGVDPSRTDFDYDAGDADAMLQIACFGDVVYS